MPLYDVPINDILFIGNKKIILHYDIALNETSELKCWENVVCYDLHDNVIWKINGREETKYWLEDEIFVGISKDEKNNVYTTGFSGNVFIINPETGKAVFYKFLK